eukprot:CAMPEP_0206451628 /NCGR_PEP_ID=MMETSP0324_2-20121206/19457_1 /ASSEMBLY_ACC=CAM_ASM_000836 /TAXON_ID=2866 /ORGANISM="Crypthecodinium cohnii, Strain Seligo" /LENGTH=276 /DNA_ID=CAMNT_0053921551 /DNA_START=52 /DNA_END=882 /DNA_ORIENTATION=+
MAASLNLETVAVTADTESGIVRVELNRPKNLNAMNMQLFMDVRKAFDTLSEDPDCRVIILSGRGKGFTAGLDVLEPKSLPAPTPEVSRYGFNFMKHLTIMQDAFSAAESCLKPVIAVPHGPCIGAGIDLITACDVRVCTASTVFSIREAAVGLAADVGTLARLPKIVGNESLVRELALTARNFSAQEAKEMGLVSRVLASEEEAMKAALEIAKQIIANSPVAVAGTKKNLNFARDHQVAESLDYVRTWNACMIQSEDLKKAMKAAMSKSKPTYAKL